MEPYLKQFMVNEEDCALIASTLSAEGVSDPTDLAFLSEATVKNSGALSAIGAPEKALVCRAAAAQSDRGQARVGLLLLAAQCMGERAVATGESRSQPLRTTGRDPGCSAARYVAPMPNKVGKLDGERKPGGRGTLRAREPTPPGSGAATGRCLGSFPPPGCKQLSLAAREQARFDKVANFGFSVFRA